MKIRTKLLLNIILPVTSTILICLIIFFPLKARFKTGKMKFDLVEKISNETIFLGVLTHEYLIYPEERVNVQWKIKAKSLKTLLSQISHHIDTQKEKNFLSLMQGNYQKIEEYFQPILRNAGKGYTPTALKRLESFSLLNVQYLINNAVRLKIEIYLKQQRTLYQGLLLILTPLVLNTFFIAIISALLNRSIFKSLKILNQGVTKVSEGNLAYVIDSPHKDEMGNLASAFNEMTKKLNHLYEDLSNEIQYRKKAENAASKNEERLRLLFNSGSDAIFVLALTDNNEAGRFIECNDIACQRYGYAKNEILKMRPHELNALEVVNEVPENLKRVLTEGNAVFETIHQTKDNKKIPVEINARTFTLEKETAILAIVRDISERKLMQDRLMEVLELNQTIISESLLGIIAYNATGQCVLANQAAAKNIGTSVDQVLNQNYHKVESWKKVGLYDSAEVVMRTGEPQKEVIHVDTSFGKEVWLSCHLKKFQLKGESHLLLIFDNITDQKMTEQELRLKNEELEQSNKELDDFAYIASHDLKEPLRGISSYSSFLLEDYGDQLNEDGRNKLNTLVQLCQREEKMIESLLWYSRIGRSELAVQEIDLNEQISSIIESIKVLIEEQNVQIKIPSPLPSISGDPLRVNEIYYNLVTNAIKFNDKQEKWVELGTCELSAMDAIASAALRDDQDKPVFYVRDNGIGIRANHQDKVFKIFKRLHAKDKYGGGTGVGLSIVKKNIDRVGGKIWMDSTFGKGTTFYFTLGDNSVSSQ